MEPSQVSLLYYLTPFHNCDKIIRKLVYRVTRIAVFFILKLPFASYFHNFSDYRWDLDQ